MELISISLTLTIPFVLQPFASKHNSPSLVHWRWASSRFQHAPVWHIEKMGCSCMPMYTKTHMTLFWGGGGLEIFPSFYFHCLIRNQILTSPVPSSEWSQHIMLNVSVVPWQAKLSRIFSMRGIARAKSSDWKIPSCNPLVMITPVHTSN